MMEGQNGAVQPREIFHLRDEFIPSLGPGLCLLTVVILRTLVVV